MNEKMRCSHRAVSRNPLQQLLLIWLFVDLEMPLKKIVE